jgi:hypothetical protein
MAIPTKITDTAMIMGITIITHTVMATSMAPTS